MTDKICCPQCKGNGKVLLSRALPHQARTLDLLRKFGPMTATELQKKSRHENILVTGMNNRLEGLRTRGFVTREKCGREWIYKAREAA
jgi:hypothetical protein